MISIAYQTEFTGCKMVLSIFGNIGGTARITVRDTVTMDVVQEVDDIGTEYALQLYNKLFDMCANKCENCKMPCCTL